MESIPPDLRNTVLRNLLNIHVGLPALFAKGRASAIDKLLQPPEQTLLKVDAASIERKISRPGPYSGIKKHMRWLKRSTGEF